MSTINTVGIVVLLSVILISDIVKYYAKRKLSEIDGMGPVHKKDPDNEHCIYM